MTFLDLEVTVNQGTVVYVFMAKWIVLHDFYWNFVLCGECDCIV